MPASLVSNPSSTRRPVVGRPFRVAWAVIGALAVWSAASPVLADGMAPSGGWQSPLLRDHPLVGTAWAADPRGGAPTPLDAGTLLRRLLAADVVLLGEKHDNPDHHLLQAQILARLVAAGRRPTLVAEQIDADRADALAAWRATDPTDAADLGETLDWDASGWPAFSSYRPVFDRAVAAGLPIRAGDLGRDELRQIGRQGIDSLESDRRAALGLGDPLPPAAEAALDTLLIDGHCGLIPPEAAPALRGVQRARDGALALAVRDALAGAGPTDRPVVVMAGSGHARADWGVPLVLSRTAPEAAVFALALTEVGLGLEDPADALPTVDGVPAFDAVWFTPAITDRDYCADLR